MTLLNVFKPSSAAGCPQPSSNDESEDITYVRPRYEITEDDHAFCVDVDLPGVGREAGVFCFTFQTWWIWCCFCFEGLFEVRLSFIHEKLSLSLAFTCIALFWTVPLGTR